MRYTPAGVATTSFTLACDRPTAAGKEKETDFIPIVTWRQTAEACANYLRKGRLCAREGRIQVRNYENNEGKRVYVTEVIADNVRFLERGEQQQQESAATTTTNNQRDPFSSPDGKPIDISDDDLPF
jgi:single-strand DNA-binding protein